MSMAEPQAPNNSEEQVIHKAIVQRLVALAPEGCEEVLLEFLCVEDRVEISARPEAVADHLPEDLMQAVLELTEHLERGGQRLRSGRYRVTLRGADGGAEFDASFAFHSP